MIPQAAFRETGGTKTQRRDEVSCNPAVTLLVKDPFLPTLSTLCLSVSPVHSLAFSKVIAAASSPER